jgi:hypothetical protein
LGGLTPGLRSGLSLHPPPETPGLRCCPSSLYTFPAGASTGLGSGLPFEVSPNLSSSASPVSQASTQVSLSPLRMPFRHARARLSYFSSLMIGHVARFYTSVSSSGRCAERECSGSLSG